MRIAILLVGFGHVGRRFVQVLQEQRRTLADLGAEPVIVGITTKNRGGLFDSAGLDAVRIARQVAGGDAVGPASASQSAFALIPQLVAQSAEAHVMVETTTLEVESGEPAISHVREALRAGAHVISANKGPVAHAYSLLEAEAQAARRLFLFEGAVMDGIPIFNLVRETMPGVTVRGFRGVINSTTNHILMAMEQGQPFDAALARMQADGIAEADPSLDIDGWDAAAKVAALANVWLDARITPQQVKRAGIGPADAARARAALARGHRLKLVASAAGRGDAVDARVQLEEVPLSDPLGGLDGQANALEIETDWLGRIVITQRDGGLEQTAYALFTDLVTVAKAGTTSEVVSAGGPLAGITVLDMTRVLAGPYCTMLAADMGARVIKIEHPTRGDDTRAWGPPFLEGESAYYLSINRNKESVALDYSTPDGRAALDALIAHADVIVENFRPGTLDARGLGYADLSATHPGLIYVSISGFGHTGPRRDEAGYDAVIQAEGGLMSITGSPDGPPVRLGVAIADIAAGMFAFQGLLLALVARGREGLGQHVDVALLDSVAALLTYQAGRYLATGESPERLGNRHATIVPYNTFDTAEGVLVLAVGNDDQFQRFCQVAGLMPLASDSRFTTNAGRVVHHDALQPLVARALLARPAEDWATHLRAAGVPCGAVRSIGDALTDPQILARAMVDTVSHPTIGSLPVLGLPVKLSATPGALRTPPPRLGEHTAQVLRDDLGYDDLRIQRLADAGVIHLLRT